MGDTPKPGTIGWFDLTVENAPEVRDFYQKVVGWKAQEVDMDGYRDYSMLTEAGDCVAGVCHARGSNADLPNTWLMYINVVDVVESAKACEENGGEIVVTVRSMGYYRDFCVVRDPAGAVTALISPPRTPS